MGWFHILAMMINLTISIYLQASLVYLDFLGYIASSIAGQYDSSSIYIIFFKKIYFVCTSICLHVCLCIPHECLVPVEPEEGVRSLELEL